jgi:hypothetical protein
LGNKTFVRLPLCFSFISLQGLLFLSINSFSQAPEILMREFASSQIKKGVRSIGMGGNGATWGNYSLTWRDSSTALLNVANTTYQNSNQFSFTAVGATSPHLWKGWVVYAIALSQYAADIKFMAKSPAFGTAATPVTGNGSNQAVFVKIAKELRKGWSFGFLLSYERSQFAVNSINDPSSFARYQTNWLPSGGFGITWQPDRNWLFGFRGLFNHDLETRTDNISVQTGLNLQHEYRLGFSRMLWKGALIDVGGNMRYRYNEIDQTKTLAASPNIGFEQNFLNRKYALRFGLDEKSPTGGFSIRMFPVALDVAYIRNIGNARLNSLFGEQSNSLIATLIYNYWRPKEK